MSYLLEIVGRGLLADLAAAFRDRLIDQADLPTEGLQRLVDSHPDKSEHHVRLGVRALTEGRAVDARTHFEDALARDLNHVTAILGLACALDECGQPREAAQQLENALAFEPQDPAILFALGFCWERLGEPTAAEAVYRASLEAAPHLRNGHERIAALCLRRQDVGSAIAQYEELCWHEPGDIDMQLALAGLYVHAGRSVEAIQRYQYALTIDPDNWDIQNDLVAALADAGQYDEAIHQLERLIELHPGHADHQLRLGDLRARVGNMVEARAAYLEAVRLNPDYLEAYIKLGTTHLRDGEYLEAAESFNTALELNDRLMTAYVGLSVAQLQAGRSDEAAATMSMAAGVEPNSTVLFAEMARLQLKASINDQVERYLVPQAPTATAVAAHAPTGDLIDEQIRRHEAALARHPGYADLHYRLGMLLRQRGRLSDALAAFHRALEINPNYVKALIKAGLAHLEADEPDAAIAAFQRALNVDPDIVELYYQLGLIFADRGRFALAVEQFERAMFLDPSNIEFRANLALALQDLGTIDRASAAWQSLCDVAPETHRGRDLLIRLNEPN